MSKPIEYTTLHAPTLADFHRSRAFVRGVRGPIGCVRGDTLIVTQSGPTRIDRLVPGERVLSYDGKTDQFRFVPASGGFPKGKDYLYIYLSSS